MKNAYFWKNACVMSTIVLEVEETRKELLIDFLTTLPYVHGVRQETNVDSGDTGHSVLGKYRKYGITTATLEHENNENKRLEND